MKTLLKDLKTSNFKGRKETKTGIQLFQNMRENQHESCET